MRKYTITIATFLVVGANAALVIGQVYTMGRHDGEGQWIEWECVRHPDPQVRILSCEQRKVIQPRHPMPFAFWRAVNYHIRLTIYGTGA